MKKPGWKYLGWLLVITFQIVACAGNPPGTISSTPMTTAKLLSTPTSTNLAQRETDTPIATFLGQRRTATPTTSLLPQTISPTLPTMSPTITNTMTVGEREQMFVELVQSNAGCNLPCWWGFVPDVTPWMDVNNFLLRSGVQIVSEADSDGTVFYKTGGFDLEGKIYNGIGFVDRNGILESIYVMSDEGSNQSEFGSLWEEFSPSKILNTYGPPSRIWLMSSSGSLGDTGRNGYVLWLFYDELGFLVRYDGSVKHSSIYHFCPRLEDGGDIGRIGLLLQSPDNPQPLDRFEDFSLYERKYVKTIEDAAGINEIAFHNLFKEENSGCFDTPRNIWP